MVDFSTSYRPPGSYIEEAAAPVLSTTLFGTSSAVAIVGPSRDYQTFSQTVTLTGTTGVALDALGIDTDSLVVQALDGSETFVLTTDYTITSDEGDDSGSDTDNITTVARASSGGISSGETVRVTGRYTDVDFYVPRRFSTLEDISDVYGPPIDMTDGTIVSPITMGAHLAIANGARDLYLVATPGTDSVTTSALMEAYTKLLSIWDIGFVVPISVGISGTDLSPGDVAEVGSDLSNHVVAAAADGIPCLGFFGADLGTTIDPATVAAGVTGKRVAYVGVPQRLFYSYENQVFEVPSIYLAAAAAGAMAGLPASEGLTRTQIRGFSGIPADVLAGMTKTNKDAWSEGGVMVAEMTRENSLVIRHGVSTLANNALNRELSVTRGIDTLNRNMQESLDSSGLIGGPVDEDTVLSVKSIAQGVLETADEEGVIYSYQNLGTRVKPGDPLYIEVQASIKPTWPLNYIVWSYTIDVSTGDIDFENAADPGDLADDQ